MKPLIAILLVSIVGLIGSAPRATAQQEKGQPSIESARPFLEMTCKHLASTNPRVRYSAREALRNFAAQAVPMIKAARDTAKDPNVKAFLDRTLGHVRLLLPGSKLRKGAAKKSRLARKNRLPYDIDQIANIINLTFAQIAKLDPILRRHLKDVAALWAEMREAGALKDKAAYRDLNDEIKLMVKNAEPKLRTFLDAKQTEYVKRLMLRLSAGGGKKTGADLPTHLAAWQRDLTERWKARDTLSEDELRELKEEWGEFKREAYRGRK